MIEVPQQVIVVEGKSDTARLRQCFGDSIKTIETGGSAVDQSKLEQIKKAHETFGVIVLTDPDVPGQRIRRLISQFIPSVQHAHLLQDQAQSDKANESLGVEHASCQAIKQALKDVLTYIPPQEQIAISMNDLMKLGLTASKGAHERREKVARHFKLGYVNAKQLQKALTMYNIQMKDVKELLKESEDNQ